MSALVISGQAVKGKSTFVRCYSTSGQSGRVLIVRQVQKAPLIRSPCRRGTCPFMGPRNSL